MQKGFLSNIKFILETNNIVIVEIACEIKIKSETFMKYV